MKLIIILLLISQCLFARRFEVTSIETIQDFDARFYLFDERQINESAVLDCQSFFQKFEIFDKTQYLYQEHFITMSQCQQIYENTVNCFDQGLVKCVDTDNIYSADCKCSK